MGPGWHCDGCGDYRAVDGKEVYSVEKRELRAENQRLALHIEFAATQYLNDLAMVRDRYRAENAELRERLERQRIGMVKQAELNEDTRLENVRLRHKLDDLERTAAAAEDMRDASDAEVERLRAALVAIENSPETNMVARTMAGAALSSGKEKSR